MRRDYLFISCHQNSGQIILERVQQTVKTISRGISVEFGWDFSSLLKIMWVSLMMWAVIRKICCISGTEFSVSLKEMLVMLSATSRMPIQGLCVLQVVQSKLKCAVQLLWIIHRDLFLFIIQMRISILHVLMCKCKLRNGEFWWEKRDKGAEEELAVPLCAGQAPNPRWLFVVLEAGWEEPPQNCTKTWKVGVQAEKTYPDRVLSDKF